MSYMASYDIMANNDPVISFSSALLSHDYGVSNARRNTIPPAIASTSTLHVPAVTLSSPGKPRQLSEKEWENLKDLLYTYYIQENKTLENVKKMMRESHGIFLTDKQLTKRFAKWKFKKNVKEAETGTFLQKAEFTSREVECSVEGVRITVAKRERWEKRARTTTYEGLQSSSASQQPSSINAEGSVETFFAYGYEGEFAGDVSLENSATPVFQSRSILSPNMISSLASANPVTPVIPASPEGFYISQGDTSQQFPSNSAGSLSSISEEAEHLLLHRLFSALSLAPPDDITLFIQSAPATEKKIHNSETISNEEFIDLSHGGGSLYWHSSQMTVHSVHKHFSRKRTASSAFKYPGRDVLFPSETIVFPSAFSGELYPFPKHEENRFETKPIRKYHDTWRLRVQKYKEKTAKLEISFPGNILAVITSINKLAIAYQNLRNDYEAERQYNRILPTLVQLYGSNSHYVVSVKTDLAEVIMYLERYTEANQLAQEVYKSALGIDVPCGHLIQKALRVLAQTYGHLGNLKKEEELLRELVQIRLVSSGPRHGDTLAAIRNLSESIKHSRRHPEVEEMLRVVFELSKSAYNLSDLRKCLIFRELAIVFYDQRNYLDSEVWFRKTVEMSERLLGSECLETLRSKFWLCKVLRKRGFFEESHRILLQTVEKQIENLGELKWITIDSMEELSALLVQMKRMEEAGMWRERARRCTQEIGGV